MPLVRIPMTGSVLSWHGLPDAEFRRIEATTGVRIERLDAAMIDDAGARTALYGCLTDAATRVDRLARAQRA